MPGCWLLHSFQAAAATLLAIRMRSADDRGGVGWIRPSLRGGPRRWSTELPRVDLAESQLVQAALASLGTEDGKAAGGRSWR